MRKNLPAVGQSYKHADLPLSAQVTKNWFPEINSETSVVVSLQPFPGATVFSTGLDGNDRGCAIWGNHVYKVSGATLYQIDNSGIQTSIGTIDGTGMCTFPASAEHLVIVSSGKAYLYSSGTFSQIADLDLESPDYGAYLNNQWIYQGEKGRFAVSDAGQPDEINGLNYATAESDGDALVRVYVYRQLLYLFGERTIETWYNTGVGRPPFDRVEGGIAQQGLAAADSLSHNDNFIYFLGDDRLIYQMSGVQTRPISTIPLSRAFEDYSDVSDAIGFCFTVLGQNFYLLSVSGTTWLFNETAGGWAELTVGNGEQQYPVTSYIYAFGKHLIADGGDLLELDHTNGLYNTQPVIRERITGIISGEMFGENFIGSKLFMSRAEIIIKGVPLLGDAPQIMLSWSDDAGYTWSNERILECGELGNYTFKAVAHQLGSFYDRVFKIRISDESSYAIHRMSGDIDVGN